MALVPLGINAKLYYGTAGITPSSIATNVKDIAISMSNSEVDVTTRANVGVESIQAGLQGYTLTFTMFQLGDDAGYQAIIRAFANKTLIALMPLTDTIDNDGEGPDADWAITECARDEANTEAISYSVTARINTFRSYKNLPSA